MTCDRAIWTALLLLAACNGSALAPARGAVSSSEPAVPDLRAPDAFDPITDPAARSAALFVEASRVMTSPRCVNCHPADDNPRQGDEHAIHDPPAIRGPSNLGVPGLECTSCHQDRNAELARIPGAPKWRLAPKEMAWLGKSIPELCAQVKDPARNGGKSLAQLIEHSAHDPLVGWGWHPGADRKPALGDQARFGALVAAWVQTGAACPVAEKEQGR